ncbi:MAG: hypothetical protein LBL01_03385, partial [Bifidobacteriaceae bacterium]|nr:hypothetical protein [Bifidobacteriaceae bacterium]
SATATAAALAAAANLNGLLIIMMGDLPFSACSRRLLAAEELRHLKEQVRAHARPRVQTRRAALDLCPKAFSRDRSAATRWTMAEAADSQGPEAAMLAGRRVSGWLPAAAGTAAVLIAVAWCAVAGADPFGRAPLRQHLLYYPLYLLAITAWAAAIWARLPTPATRGCLTAMAALTVAWGLERMVKLQIADPGAVRHLWYAFYLPMLVLPTLLAVIACRVVWPGRPRAAQRALAALLAADAVLLALVCANDLHQRAFRFTAWPWDQDHYAYGPVYFAVAVWSLAQIGGFLALTVSRARERTLAGLAGPVLLVAAALGYCAAYALGWPPLRRTELTVGYGLLAFALLEIALRAGLIPNGRGQVWALRNASLDLTVLDQDGSVVFATAAAGPLPKGVTRAAVAVSGSGLPKTVAPGGTRNGGPGRVWHVYPVRGGSAVAGVDLAAVERRVAALRRANAALAAEEARLREGWQDAGRELARGRATGRVTESLGSAAAEVAEIAGRLERDWPSLAPTQRRMALAQLKLWVCYCKRRAAVAAYPADDSASPSRFALRLRELVEEAAAGGVCGTVTCARRAMIAPDEANAAYELVFRLLDAAIGRGETACAIAVSGDSGLILRLAMDGPQGLAQASERVVARCIAEAPGASETTEEDGTWFALLRFGGLGERRATLP